MAAPFITRPNAQTLAVTDYDGVTSRPAPGDLAKLSAPLPPLLTAELDETELSLGLTAEVILLAALGRSIARTIGAGLVAVDRVGDDGLVHTVMLNCVTHRETDATAMLTTVLGALAAASQSDSVAGARGPVDVRFSVVATAAAANPDYAVELRIHRAEDELQLDWCYDTRRLLSSTVEELSEQFPLALIELTSEATPPFAR
jgi:hypothetical protein